MVLTGGQFLISEVTRQWVAQNIGSLNSRLERNNKRRRRGKFASFKKKVRNLRGARWRRGSQPAGTRKVGFTTCWGGVRMVGSQPVGARSSGRGGASRRRGTRSGCPAPSVAPPPPGKHLDQRFHRKRVSIQKNLVTRFTTQHDLYWY